MSSLFRWFFNTLGSLGLDKHNSRVAILGLDNVGKATLLYMLNNSILDPLQPTFTRSEKLFKARSFDLGGHQIAREMMNDCLNSVDAVIFLVDSADRERLFLAREELFALLTIEKLQTTPFLILGNKIDLPNAATEEELKEMLRLDAFLYSEDQDRRPMQVFMCSLTQNTGCVEGFSWLSQCLLHK